MNKKGLAYLIAGVSAGIGLISLLKGFRAEGSSFTDPFVRVDEAALMERFLPILKLHPDDEYRPSPVNWFLRRVELRYKDHETPILKVGQVSVSNLDKQSHNGISSGGSQESDFYLHIPENSENEIRKGTTQQWGCYPHVSRRNPIEIQYWFFYPYSGYVAPVLDIAHGGDWEHITVRLTTDNKRIDQIFFAAHENGTWVPAAGHVNDQGRPIVYSAKKTHASYPEVRNDWPLPFRAIAPKKGHF